MVWRVSSMIAIFKLTAHWVFVKDWLSKHDASLPRMPPLSGQSTQTKYTFKTFRRCPVHLLNVLCTSCAQGRIAARLKWYFPIGVCYFPPQFARVNLTLNHVFRSKWSAVLVIFTEVILRRKNFTFCAVWLGFERKIFKL